MQVKVSLLFTALLSGCHSGKEYKIHISDGADSVTYTMNWETFDPKGVLLFPKPRSFQCDLSPDRIRSLGMFSVSCHSDSTTALASLDCNAYDAPKKWFSFAFANGNEPMSLFIWCE